MKSIIILHSYHHYNTRKVAEEFSTVLDAPIEQAITMNEQEIPNYDLVGFGAGIDSGKHYKELLDFVDKLPSVTNKKCFIFSTSAVQGERKVFKDHKRVRDTLKAKGYIIIGEFSCKGFNTNVFLKYIGGMNKTRPNAEDLEHAKEFALGIIDL
ncbi:MAG: flavodoxin family protein [Firmicutes bacterium]|nr:flavodoxin family protein [Bacillota bacterium]